MTTSLKKTNYNRPRYAKKAKWEKLQLLQAKKRHYGLRKYTFNVTWIPKGYKIFSINFWNKMRINQEGHFAK